MQQLALAAAQRCLDAVGGLLRRPRAPPVLVRVPLQTAHARCKAVAYGPLAVAALMRRRTCLAVCSWSATQRPAAPHSCLRGSGSACVCGGEHVAAIAPRGCEFTRLQLLHPSRPRRRRALACHARALGAESAVADGRVLLDARAAARDGEADDAPLQLVRELDRPLLRGRPARSARFRT